MKQPCCIIIAGPNGAGKTTFAREFLPREAGVIHFVNVDLIAGGLSPLDPNLASLAAGKLLLKELRRLAHARLDFAFESTLSGLAYARRIREWKAAGYRIEIYFMRLSSPSLALRRIAARVKQGGHNVSRHDVLRRFDRARQNFENIYRPLADAWFVYDNSKTSPYLIEEGP
ncbi:MAG TPA: zeta toxin family protein [Pyrinomonadaceae bacterium]|nr:zeta toxin family protein [Pyrinomonadaceae bacterium]